MTADPSPVLLGRELLPEDPAEIIYLTKYFGKLDTGIAFTDYFYLDALARSPLSTFAFANQLPAEIPTHLIRYSASFDAYRRQRPLLQIVNGLGSFQQYLPGGYLPEHHESLKFAVIHDEPAAYDFYGTSIWNRENVADNLMLAQDGFIFVSSESQRAWNEYPRVAEKPQFYLPNTCAEERHIVEELLPRSREEVRQELGYSPDEVNLVVVATVQPRKAQITAVEALARLREEDPARAYRLRLLGRVTQPQYGAELMARIEELGLGDLVEVGGQVPKSEALKHIYASDLLLSTSGSEAMPLALLEAMLLETPIITTLVGGVGELLDDACAEFFAPGDAAALAGCIGHLAGDPAAAAALRAAAVLRYRSEFSNDRFRERFAAILKEIVALVPHAQLDRSGPAGSGNGLVIEEGRLVLSAPSDGPSRRRQRLELAGGAGWSEVDHASVRQAESGGIASALRDAAPLLRDGYAVLGVRPAEVQLRRVSVADPSPVFEEGGIAALANSELFAADLRDDLRRRLSAVEGIANQRKGQISRLNRRWIGPKAIKLLRRVPGAIWLADTLRGRRRVRPGKPVESTPATILIFNSPMQMLSGLALWDQRHAATDESPLVAAVYSTGGAEGFSKELTRLAQKTGRFRKIVDITEPYKRVYAKSGSFQHFVGIKREILQMLGPFEGQTVLIAAFMSAKAQKLLYEIFSGATIRLFEDGLGSYVRKPIKMSDTGLVDRVTSGDCAEAYHIRRIASVDLLLDRLPVPPQYAGAVDGLRYPQLTVGGYRVDYAELGRLLDVHPRRFEPDEALMVTQNFFDHLGGQGLSLELEREINDTVIGRLLDSGYRVVLRPHPRASDDVWSARWEAEPRVTIWREDPGVPVELLIAPDALPGLMTGVSSSCLFYFSGEQDMEVRRYSDEDLDSLSSRSTPEYVEMFELARTMLTPLV